MKLNKTSRTIKLSRSEWENIGRQAGWLSVFSYRVPLWGDSERISEQGRQYIEILRSVGIGEFKQGSDVFSSSIELMDDTMGTAYIQVFMDSKSETPAVIVDKYYESELMDERLGKKVSVPIDLNDISGSANRIRQAIENIMT